VAQASGATTPVLSIQDLGCYEWERAWCRIDPSEERKGEYLGATARIAAPAKKTASVLSKTRTKLSAPATIITPTSEAMARSPKSIYQNLMKHQ